MKELDEKSSVVQFADDVHKQKPMKGILSYTVFKNGVSIEKVKEENLIVNGARNQMARLIAGSFAGRNIAKIAFGVNGTSPAVTNETLTGKFEKNIDGYSFSDIGQVQFDWSLGTTEANGMSILEFGLVTEDGTLFSRRVRENGKPINKESDIFIVGQWVIVF